MWVPEFPLGCILLSTVLPHMQLNDGVTFAEARQRESDFFSADTHWAAVEDDLGGRLGTANLRNALSDVLVKRIVQELPIMSTPSLLPHISAPLACRIRSDCSSPTKTLPPWASSSPSLSPSPPPRPACRTSRGCWAPTRALPPWTSSSPSLSPSPLPALHAGPVAAAGLRPGLCRHG